jgi:hypothetical protein
MASFIYNSYGKKLFDNSTKISLSTDTIKVALTNSSYTPNRYTHYFFDDITNEISGSGYTAGGETLGSVTLTQDDSNDRIIFDAADTTWANSSIPNARYAVIYKSTGTPGTSPLIALIDFGSNRSSSLTTFTIQWNSSGIIRTTLS